MFNKWCGCMGVWVCMLQISQPHISGSLNAELVLPRYFFTIKNEICME